MDLYLHDATPTDDERHAIDDLLGPPASGWDGGERTERDGHVALGGHGARSHRHLLLPALNAAQSRIGWLSEGALNYIAIRLNVPPAEVWSVATFYALLATTPRPRRVLHACDDIACRIRGGRDIVAALGKAFGPDAHHGHQPGNGVEIGEAAWLPSPCLGLCEQAPAVLLTVAGAKPVEESMGGVTPGQAVAALKSGSLGGPGRLPIPQRGDPTLRLLRRVGVADPASLEAYTAAGGYQAFRKALDIGPEAIIREVTDAKLMGRGGAAFPTGRKWDAVRSQPVTPHYVICNADESEPGTFKDRVLLEEDPFAIVEAVTIAGFAVGAQQGYIYIRGEYPLAIERVQGAIDQARTDGFLGGNILGRNFEFDIEIRKGAGAYICGEETALFNSIEGYRGEPRNKPPFPVQSGLFRKPTLVNNVETLANIPWIILEGGAAFAATGTSDSSGTRLFCLSGAISRPGVYEITMGMTLGQVLDLAGGPPPGRTIQAILLGGAAGGFVRGNERDIVLTFEGARAAGVTLGSGVIMAFDDTVDLTDTILRIAAFFRDESCGQCVPCRVGTVRQEEALHRLANGKANGAEVALLDEVGRAMKDASICGLGQTAYGAVESAIKRLGLFTAGKVI
ncbi:MAG: NAD(P)H-dependent oxidoreductase subunit E [Gemmatimonadota bacterium]